MVIPKIFLNQLLVITYSTSLPCCWFLAASASKLNICRGAHARLHSVPHAKLLMQPMAKLRKLRRFNTHRHSGEVLLVICLPKIEQSCNCCFSWAAEKIKTRIKTRKQARMKAGSAHESKYVCLRFEE